MNVTGTASGQAFSAPVPGTSETPSLGVYSRSRDVARTPLTDRQRRELIAEMQALIPALRGRARQLIWKDDVEDLIQDTVERAVRALDRFTPGTNLRGWLFVILIHRGRDLINRERRRPRADALDLDRLPAPSPDPPPAPGFSREEIVLAMNEVKEPFRQALMLRVIDKKSYAEIAEIQHCPVATAGTRIKRAREAMQAVLGRMRTERGDSE